jgi:3-hydroxymyristoyl/3-hydroxydecanoyl-(acyl carrier protein) dehydratase
MIASPKNSLALTREHIAAMLPHGNALCLLDEVVHWDAESISCRCTNIANSNNPLMEHNQLDAVLLIEYAAQAAGVHAALVQAIPSRVIPLQTIPLHAEHETQAAKEVRPAYIGAVKNIELLCPPNSGAAIDIEAQCLLNNNQGAIYEVTVQQHGVVLIRGRLILNQS